MTNWSQSDTGVTLGAGDPLSEPFIRRNSIRNSLSRSVSVIQSPGSLISYNIHRGNLVWEQGITIKQSDSYCHNLITISNVWIVPDAGKLGELTLDFGQYLIVIYSYHNQVSDISCDWASVQTEWGTKNKMRLDLNWLLSSVYRHTVVQCLVTQHWRQGDRVPSYDHDSVQSVISVSYLCQWPLLWLTCWWSGTSVTNYNDVLDGKKCY